ncbi:MAG: hypothetical protein BGP12_20890 [Rhodospirillales bacterium 70-18]|nr:tetratricopeptide repeat protein [Rhodospirillales bacterium]OJY70220.1 MAG: hypothetical protein BGP12_20890 [Rhodospirillales bacterium 70-18]
MSAAAALHRQGVALLRLGAREQGIARLRAALAARPDFAAARIDLADALLADGQPAAAAEAYRAALAAAPRQPLLHLHLGLALRAAGQDDAARDSFARALALDPRLAAAHAGQARVLSERNRHAEALAGFRRAVELEPGQPVHRWNAALSALALGDYAQGWRDYEARWRLDVFPAAKRALPAPRWTGAEDVAGRTVLVWAEQGFGDTFQFARYLPLLAARGARVVLEAQGPACRLLARTQGVATVVEQGAELPPHDLHCPLLSLPLAFATTLATVPAAVPYLHADPAEVAAWRARLAGRGRIAVGLVWAGNWRAGHPLALRSDRRRAVDPGLLGPLAAVPGVAFVSLQKEAQRSPPETMMLHDWTAELTDFAATAALVAALDLVIGVDTAVTHLAGALGRPVWLLNRFDSDWRWLLDRADSPWYPSMCIFRPPAQDAWAPVVAAAAAALRERLGG